MTRANTPASVSFRHFLPFSPWLAPASLQGNVARQHRREYADSASLRLKSQKSLEYPSLAGAGSFAGAEMCPDKERPAENKLKIYWSPETEQSVLERLEVKSSQKDAHLLSQLSSLTMAN